MHNGKIAEFDKVKRRLRRSLNDTCYNLIQGTTDSEHAFALFLNILGDRINDYSITDFSDAMIATINQILEFTREAGIDSPSYLNFVLSDGHSIVASRHVSHSDYEPASLYISVGERLEVREGRYHMAASDSYPTTAILASEPLTAQRSDWQAVQPNSLVTVTPQLHIEQLDI